MDKYKKEIIICIICFVLCIGSFILIKNSFFSSKSINEPAKNILNNLNNASDDNYKRAVTIPSNNNKEIITSVAAGNIETIEDEIIDSEYPYEIAPTFVDDGSIIYDGLTLTQLTDKLNKSLPNYLTNTGYFFANYTKSTGLDPYLAVSIVLLESGCKWGCSSLTRNCNNIGGLKGGTSCNGGSYRKYNTLGEGINGFLNIIYKNYYLQGLTTPELMGPRYAQSSTWAEKVRAYMNEVKAK